LTVNGKPVLATHPLPDRCSDTGSGIRFFQTKGRLQNDLPCAQQRRLWDWSSRLE
jgi:hypothetical protein